MYRVMLLACTCVLVAAIAAAPASANPRLSLDEAATMFGSRSSGFAADLSPSGDKMVYLSAGPGASTIAHVRDLTKDVDRILVRSTGKPEQLEYCGFVDERWVICSFGGQLHSGKFVYRVGRTVAVDTTSGAIRRLSAPVRDSETFLQFDGHVIDWLPEQPGSILMQRNYAGENGSAERIGVDRIQVDPFKTTVVETALSRDYDYVSDGLGDVRLRGESVSDVNDNFTGLTRYEYRTSSDRRWVSLPQNDPDFSPLAIDRSTNSLYFLKPLNGRAALYSFRMDGSSQEKLIASNPNVDIDSVIRLGPGEPVVGYRYTDDRTRSVYTDSATEALAKALSKALPQMPLMDVVAMSHARDKLLIHAGSDVDPGVFFLLDRKSNRMDPVLDSSDIIQPASLAPMKAVTIPTADGKSIPAYVTIAADAGPGPHPAVVMPHGGPSARDDWRFDWLGQFLASQGYVVIQPNFRGSSGYGKEFLGENAFHNWRKAMSDISDSADWLSKQGIADPNRIAIVGWSYGGYAALQSAAMDHRYKAVVAIAPVTDLKQLRRDAEDFRDSRIERDAIGKGDQLVDGSPINRAADIHAPVLLVHGTVDGNVSYDHSKHMLAALKHSGADADLLTFDGLDHQLADSDARKRMLNAIGALLARTIGK